MTVLRVTTMISLPDAGNALLAKEGDVIVSDCADLDDDPTCHILFLPENKDLVAPLLPKNVPVPDWENVKRVCHYGHGAHQVSLHIKGFELDLQDEVWEATLRGLSQEACASWLGE